MSVATDVSRDNPGVIAPPPLIAFAALALGFALDWLLPVNSLATTSSGWPGIIIGGLLVVAGLAIGVPARMRFIAAGTNVNPWKPTLKLATGGIFTRLRNPMYAGMLLIVCGIGVARPSVWILLMLVPMALLLHFGAVLREERYLEAKFGDEYRSYKARVPRWGLF